VLPNDQGTTACQPSILDLGGCLSRRPLHRVSTAFPLKLRFIYG
jgi:hypothetical protein